jgi:DNA-binding response OmpR family regulator
MDAVLEQSPRALVVENDLSSRELLARVLRLRGVDAQTAVGLGQAAALLQQGDADYDLLVVDLHPAAGDGVELLRQVSLMDAAHRPRKIVVISETISGFYPRVGELQLDLELFQKPVHLPSLMKVVDGLKAEGGRRKAD